jgi:predicted RNA binding protein YcfA (HicA-like mRNA interferase family)
MKSSTLQRWRFVLGRLRVFSGAAVCVLLTAHGFREVRRRGSHVVMQKRTEGSTITVPVPDHKELRIGTLQAIIRQSQLPRALFEVES